MSVPVCPCKFPHKMRVPNSRNGIFPVDFHTKWVLQPVSWIFSELFSPEGEVNLSPVDVYPFPCTFPDTMPAFCSIHLERVHFSMSVSSVLSYVMYPFPSNHTSTHLHFLPPCFLFPHCLGSLAGIVFHISLADFGRAHSRTGVFRTVFYSVFLR